MLQQDSFDFLARLKNNNSTQWAHDHQDEMYRTKNDVTEFAACIVAEVSKFDEAIAKKPPKPETCVTRLNRDMRFGKGKGPYKTDFYIVVGLQGIQGLAASYAVHIEPGNCFVGGGAPNPKGPDLLNYRRKVSYGFKDFERIVTSHSFVELFPNGIQSQSGKSLKRGPLQFEHDDPAMEYLKKDGFITREFLPDVRLTISSGLKEIVDLLKGSKPLIDFLNHA
ncbi:DUF2461 domain-containing protein [Methylobacterium bullatum]|uniref:TIGR02453 family protein n=1 Tax=Methylobacterium bullatum TaxID=570505 RepID=A0AAV4ZDM6_9HYPH|nr:DUF2461 domain-containing protein [Methylobacterium bullatum]MBD8903611.1 hypothetical protein [Methylobacterium bullatum]GJD41922.1 hypothetical protein OICFNHDK_4406 [Methylobacterium bullatum]